MISLPDWAFYPLAAAVIGAGVFAAINARGNEFRSQEDILEAGLVYEGADLNAITLGNGLEATLLEHVDGTFIRIAAVRGPLDGPRSAGAFYTLSPDEISALQGHNLQITFRIRTADENGANTTRLTFFTQGISQESWREQELHTDFANYTITVTPPHCTWDYAFIGLWPDWNVSANSIDVERVSLEVVEASEC